MSDRAVRSIALRCLTDLWASVTLHFCHFWLIAHWTDTFDYINFWWRSAPRGGARPMINECEIDKAFFKIERFPFEMRDEILFDRAADAPAAKTRQQSNSADAMRSRLNHNQKINFINENLFMADGEAHDIDSLSRPSPSSQENGKLTFRCCVRNSVFRAKRRCSIDMMTMVGCVCEWACLCMFFR